MMPSAQILTCLSVLTAGLLLFWQTWRLRQQTLATAAQRENDNDNENEGGSDLRRAVLWQPGNELLLAVVFCLASFFFAVQLFPEPRWTPPLVALGVALLSTIGAWERLQQAWKEAAVPAPLLAALQKQRLPLSLAMLILLAGVLVLFLPGHWFA